MVQSSNVESLGRQHSRPFFLATALAGWLLVLPAVVFLAAGALRLLQPREFQPSRTAWIIFEWAGTHVTHLDAAVIFLGLPMIALIAGCGTLLRAWRRKPVLRQDAASAFVILRRQLVAICLVAAVLLAGGILTFVVDHLIVG
jgi:hypothetical protein